MLFFNLTLKPLAPFGCTKPVVTGLLVVLHEAEHGSTWFGAIQVPKPSVPLFCAADLKREGSAQQSEDLREGDIEISRG